MPRKEVTSHLTHYMLIDDGKFSSYLEVCVVDMFKDQSRCPGLQNITGVLLINSLPIHLPATLRQQLFNKSWH